MSDEEFVLTVIAGPNAGAMTHLAPGRHSFGGGPSDSIVLDNLPESVLALSLRGNAVRIDSASELAKRFGGESADLAEAKQFQLPAVFGLGDETLVALARSRSLPAPRRSPLVVAAIALCAFGFGMIGSANLRFDGAAAGAAFRPLPEFPPLSATPPAGTPSSGTSSDFAAVTAPPPSADRGAGCDDRCLATAAAGLRSAMDAAGLQDLSLAQGDGVLRVSGTLPPAKRGVWMDLRRDFESTHGQSLPLLVTIGETTAAKDHPGFDVASVWLGDRPEIRSSTGEVLRAGDRTRDGWQVEEIGPGRVTLRRGETMAEVRF